MYKQILVLLLVHSFGVLSTRAQANVGNRCTRSFDKQAGTCRKFSLCPAAIRFQQVAGIEPDICGHDATEAIVCCVETKFSPNLGNSDSGPNKRISEQKCELYSQLARRVINVVSLVADGGTSHTTVESCNYTNVQLVVGGEKTAQGEFPHMALIGWPDGNSISWKCGGSLISEEFILTATHCTSNRGVAPIMIRLGEQNTVRDDDGANPVDIPIAEIIRHPNYRYPAKYNDIALMRLQRKPTFDRSIRPACLWPHKTFPRTHAIATGWGTIAHAAKRSDDLLKVALKIIDNEQCAPLYREQIGRKLPRGIIDTQMCAGELAGDKDTCEGDSGGPLQITNNNNRCIFNIIGVTSFGKICGTPNAPGVYTRVSSYLDWIENTVWPNE